MATPDHTADAAQNSTTSSDANQKTRVPAQIGFQTKPQIALEQIRTAQTRGIAPGVVLADAGYGADGCFRAGLTQLGLAYVVGVQPTLSVWRPGEDPLPPKPWSGQGRPQSRLVRTSDYKPISAMPWPKRCRRRPGRP